MINSRNRFTNKHVIVTGGARGIGYEISKQFGLEGAMVSVLDFNPDSLKEADQKLKAIGIEVNTYLIDISKREEVFTLIEKIDEVASIDILINNAGIASETPFLSIEEKEWKSILDINLTGMFNVGQAVCKLMASRKSGVVVNMASKNGLDGEAGYAHYNSSKGGVVMLTKSMAIELATYGIRVNAVCPGYIQTPMSMEIDSPEFTKNFVDRYIPLNRAGTVEDIAPIFLFLASDESSFITGQTIVADGGQLSGQKP